MVLLALHGAALQGSRGREAAGVEAGGGTSRTTPWPVGMGCLYLGAYRNPA